MIVGAGLAGGALALTAARRGRRVVLLDAAETPSHAPYPEILWGGSMRRFDAVDVGERVRREAGIRLRGFDVWEGAERRLVHAREPDLARAQAEPWSTDPTAVRRILVEAAIDTGFAIHLPGVTVTGLLGDAHAATGVRGTGPAGEVTVRAPLVFGADGPASTLRRCGGFTFRPKPFPVRFAVAEGPRPPDLRNIARARLQPTAFPEGVTFVALAPLPGDRAGLVAFLPRGRATTPPPELRRELAPLEPAVASWASLNRPRVLSRSIGHVDSYARHGVVLLGDAAHPVSPLGGQGADMALADAFACDRLVIARTAPGKRATRSALQAYERARRPANERALRFSRFGGFSLRWTYRVPALARLAPGALRVLEAIPGAKARVLRSEATAFEGAEGPR